MCPGHHADWQWRVTSHTDLALYLNSIIQNRRGDETSMKTVRFNTDAAVVAGQWILHTERDRRVEMVMSKGERGLLCAMRHPEDLAARGYPSWVWARTMDEQYNVLRCIKEICKVPYTNYVEYSLAEFFPSYSA